MGKKEKKSDFWSLFRHVGRKSWWAFLLLIIFGVLPFVVWPAPKSFIERLGALWPTMVKMVVLTGLLFLVIYSCRKLTDYYSLKRKETGITWCQIAILIAVILWGVGFLLIFNIHKESRSFLVLGIIGTLLGWVFQDTIKGVAAFIHLRLNNLLNIDDWIAVPKLNVDGMVKRITLTTVTIYNWDTTTSSIPISVLHSDHFINYQKMTEGKTHGRQMLKTFILDTGWFFAIISDDVKRLTDNEKIKHFLPEKEIVEGVSNAHLYRLYIYHWLMNQPLVSQQPCLVVRWLEQKESGMPLQVYAYIMEGSMPAFEWQQSKIIEHILESLEWFGMRLYQNPSSFDVSNSNIFMTKNEAIYRKEIGG